MAEAPLWFNLTRLLLCIAVNAPGVSTVFLFYLVMARLHTIKERILGNSVRYFPSSSKLGETVITKPSKDIQWMPTETAKPIMFVIKAVIVIY